MVAGIGLVMPVSTVMAEDPPEVNCDQNAGLNAVKDGNCAKGTGQQKDLFTSTGVVPTIINIMLFIVGILSVIMLIYGGIRYTASGGKDEHIKTAKNTIMYAIIGLIVAILGYAIVNWVLGSVGDKPGNYTDETSCKKAGYGWDGKKCVQKT
jgi:hypothetical protein